MENFQHQSKFLFNYNKLSVLKNVDPVIENNNIINRRKKLTLLQHITLVLCIPHFLKLKMLCNVIDFVFEAANRKHICISKNNAA